MSKLLPKKHITLEQSYLGFGAQVLPFIKGCVSIDELWQNCSSTSIVRHDFDDLILTLDYLYSINVININDEGKICLS